MEFTHILTPLSRLFKPSKLTPKNASSLTIMIISPHPDDECITSSLALRLKMENQARVINVAVTLGSNPSRQPQRVKELTSALKTLKIENEFLSTDWKQKEKELKSLIKKYQPDLILAPHQKDHHPTHIKTGLLCKKVLSSFKERSFLMAWSEYWGQMTRPNLLIEVPLEILQLQMKALKKHVGEIKRNPYHLRLPAWMMDNVRRGSELIDGEGTESSRMAYGVIYKLQIVKKGKFYTPNLKNKFLTSEDDLCQIFKFILDEASSSKTSLK